jgi:hypothetical protein
VEHFVIVRASAPGRYTAQILGIPDVRAEADTEAGAIDQVQQALTHWLASAKVVRISVPGNGTGNAWLDTFGRSAQDPEFPAFLEELQRARELA